MNKIKAFWNSLPHQVQAGVVAFATATGATLIHAFEDAGLTSCSSWSCFGHALKTVFSPHMVLTALFAGAAALKVFYMIPSKSNESH